MKRGTGSEVDDREEVLLHIVRMTDKALCVHNDNGNEVWLPLSQIDTADGGPFRRHTDQMLLVPQWLLEEKELV